MAEETIAPIGDLTDEAELAGVAAELLIACEDGGRRLEIARQQSLKVMEHEMLGLDPASLPPDRPLQPCSPRDVANEATQLLADLERRNSDVSLPSLHTTITPALQEITPCGLDPTSLPPDEPFAEVTPCGLNPASLPPDEPIACEDPMDYGDLAAQLLKDCSTSSILAPPVPPALSPRSTTPRASPREEAAAAPLSKDQRNIDPTEISPEANALLHELQSQSVLSLTSTMAGPAEEKPDLLTQLKQKDIPEAETPCGLNPASLPPAQEPVPIAEDPTAYGDLANELLRQCAVSSVLSSVYVAKSPRSVDLTTLKQKDPPPPEQPEEIAPDATLLLSSLEGNSQLPSSSSPAPAAAGDEVKDHVPTEPPQPELKPGDAELVDVAEELLRGCEGVGSGASGILALQYARKAKRENEDLKSAEPKMERAPTMEEINPMVDNLLRACEGGILAPDEAAEPEPTETPKPGPGAVPGGALKSPDRAGSRSNLGLSWALQDDPLPQQGPSTGHALSRSPGPVKKPAAPQQDPSLECRNVTNWWDTVSQPVTAKQERRVGSPKSGSPSPGAAHPQVDDISQRWQTVIRRSLKGTEIPGLQQQQQRPATGKGAVPPIPMAHLARRSPNQKPVSDYDLDSYRPIEQGKPLKEPFRPPRRRDQRSPGASSAPGKARGGGERPGYRKANSTGQVGSNGRRDQAMVGKSDSEPLPGDRSIAPSRSPAPLPAAKEGAISQLLWSYKKDAKYGNQKSLPGTSPRPVYTDVQPPSPRMYGPLQDFYGAHDEPPSAATVEMIKRMARQEEPADAWKSDFQGEKELKKIASKLGKWSEDGPYSSPRTTLAQAVRANRKEVEKKLREVLGDEMAEPILMNPNLLHDDDFGGYAQADEMSTPRMKDAEVVANDLMKSYAKYERRMNELEQSLPKAYQSAQPRPYPTNVNITRGPGWRAQSAPKLGNQRSQQGGKRSKPRPMEELMAALAGTGFAPSKTAGDAPMPARSGKSPRRNVPRASPGQTSQPGTRPLSKRALREKEMEAEIDAHVERMYDEMLRSSQMGTQDKSYSTDDAVRDFVRRSLGGRA